MRELQGIWVYAFVSVQVKTNDVQGRAGIRQSKRDKDKGGGLTQRKTRQYKVKSKAKAIRSQQ